MATVHKDFRGLKCPVPVIRLNILVMQKEEVKPGDIVEMVADCPTFEKDLKQWCAQTKKVLIKCYKVGDATMAQVQL